MAIPTAVEILMAYLQHAYDGLQAGEHQVSSRPVDGRLASVGVLRLEGFFRELLQMGLVEEWGGIGDGHLYWLSPRGQALMERIPQLDAAIRHAAGADGAGLVAKVRGAVLSELVKRGAEAVPSMSVLIERVQYWVTVFRS